LPILNKYHTMLKLEKVYCLFNWNTDNGISPFHEAFWVNLIMSVEIISFDYKCSKNLVLAYFKLNKIVPVVKIEEISNIKKINTENDRYIN